MENPSAASQSAPVEGEIDARVCAAVLEQAGEGVILVDATGRVTFANGAAKRFYGVTEFASDFCGGTSEAYRVLTPDGEAYTDNLPLVRALRGETVRDALWRIRRRDGTEILVQGTAAPVALPESLSPGAALVIRDVTALRESEEHYRQMVELNPQVPWTADPDGGLTDFNQRWLDLTGLTREQALGGGWRHVPHPDDLPRIAEAWTRALQTGEPHDMEYRMRLADGTCRWMRSRAVPRRDATGRIIRWYGTTEDIEARKQAEFVREAMVAQQRRFVREVLASMTEGRLHLVEDADNLPVPLAPAPVGASVPLVRESLRTLRAEVRAAARLAGLPMERENDLETAVGEVAMNAVIHAGGGVGQAYADPNRGVVQVWVTDAGLGIREETLHRATLEKGFSTVGTLGFGYWLVLRSVDRVYLLTGESGTTVVIEQEREAPPTPLVRGRLKTSHNGIGP